MHICSLIVSEHKCSYDMFLNTSVHMTWTPELARYELQCLQFTQYRHQCLHYMNISVYMIWKPSFTRYEHEHGQGHQKKKSNNTQQQNLVDRESSPISVKIKYSIKDYTAMVHQSYLSWIILFWVVMPMPISSFLHCQKKKFLWNKLIFLSIAKCQVIVHISGNHKLAITLITSL